MTALTRNLDPAVSHVRPAGLKKKKFVLKIKLNIFKNIFC